MITENGDSDKRQIVSTLQDLLSKTSRSNQRKQLFPIINNDISEFTPTNDILYNNKSLKSSLILDCQTKNNSFNFNTQPQCTPRKDSLSDSVNSKKKNLADMKQTKKGKVIQLPPEINPLILIQNIQEIDKNSPYALIKKKIIGIDVAVAVLAVCSLILSISDNEIYINQTQFYLKEYVTANNITLTSREVYGKMEQRTITIGENIQRGFNGGLSLLIIILLRVRYYYWRKILICDSKLTEYDNILSSGPRYQLLLECLLGIIFLPPYFNDVYVSEKMNLLSVCTINSIFAIISLLKLYFLYRIIVECTRWNTRVSTTICKSHQFTPGFAFFIKSEFKLRPIITTVSLVIIFMLLMGFITRCFEFGSINLVPNPNNSKNRQNLETFWNCIWFIICTMTTVSYGDIIPISSVGRGISIIPMTIGVVIIGLALGALSSFIKFTHEEKKAYTRLNKLFDSENKEHKAVDVIKTVMFLRRLHKKNLIDETPNKHKTFLMEKFILIFKLRTETKGFKNDYIISRAYSMPINDLMKTMGYKFYENLVNLSKQVDRISSVEEDLTIMKMNQEEIQHKLKHINSIQDEITYNLAKYHNDSYTQKIKTINPIIINSEVNLNELMIPRILINTPSDISSRGSSHKRIKKAKAAAKAKSNYYTKKRNTKQELNSNYLNPFVSSKNKKKHTSNQFLCQRKSSINTTNSPISFQKQSSLQEVVIPLP